MFKSILCLTDGSGHAEKALDLAVDVVPLRHCIVMGSCGLSDMKALLPGSVSRNVTNRARCTVIEVK